MGTYQSVSSVGINDGPTGNIVIPKPSGLVVGELMVAGIRSYLAAADVTFTPPSGWTEQETTKVTSGSNPSQRLSVYTKIADAADVAASTFTFVSSGGGSAIHGGIIVRVSAFGIINAGESSASADITATSTTLATFTPSRANCLFIFFGSRGSNVSHSADISAVSLATDNPTWTERAQVNLSVTNRSHVLSCFTASRAQSTATGTITFNFTSPGSNQLTNGIVVLISPQVNGSFDVPGIKVNAYAISPIQEIQVDAEADDLTYAARRGPAAVNNIQKPSISSVNNIPR